VGYFEVGAKRPFQGAKRPVVNSKVVNSNRKMKTPQQEDPQRLDIFDSYLAQ
jgi:hypothetical protein